jgi:hypothetical protein
MTEEVPDRTRELADELVRRANASLPPERPKWSDLWGIDPEFQAVTDPPTGKVYLVWEWTEEREAKIHHAVCSTLDKAKDAAQRLWDDECTLRGDPTSPLTWKPSGPLPDSWAGEKGQGNSPGYQDDDVPFEVEPFEIDVLLAGPQLTRITL